MSASCLQSPRRPKRRTSSNKTATKLGFIGGLFRGCIGLCRGYVGLYRGILGLCRGDVQVIYGLYRGGSYWDNGKENGNHNLRFRG